MPGYRVLSRACRESAGWRYPDLETADQTAHVGVRQATSPLNGDQDRGTVEGPCGGILGASASTPIAGRVKEIMMPEDPRRRAQNASRCVTYLKPELRYVVDLVTEEADHDSRAETIRELLLEGLKARGYSETMIRQHFLRFSLTCEETGKTNPYAHRP